MLDQKRMILCAAVVSAIIACGGQKVARQRQRIEMGSATISVLAPEPFDKNP